MLQEKNVLSNKNEVLDSNFYYLADTTQESDKDIERRMEELESDKRELKGAIDLLKALDQSYDYMGPKYQITRSTHNGAFCNLTGLKIIVVIIKEYDPDS